VQQNIYTPYNADSMLSANGYHSYKQCTVHQYITQVQSATYYQYKLTTWI